MYIKNSIDFLDNKSLDCYKDISYKYIFRDKLRPYIYGVTDEFKKMVIENNLKMQFLELYDIDNTVIFCFTLEQHREIRVSWVENLTVTEEKFSL